MKRCINGAIAVSVAALGVDTTAASCGSAFCFVNTNWSLQAYAFLQLPICQYVNGVQLTASWSATTGLSVQF